MSEGTLEVSNEPPTGVKPSPVNAVPVHKKRIGPRAWLAIALVAIAIAAGTWFLLNRRSRTAARQQSVSDSETSSSFATLSPEQRAAIAVEVAQTRTLEGDVTAPGKIAFNGNRVTPVFSQFS